jgi:hypothetical protein
MPSRKNEMIYFSFGKKRKFSDSVLVYWGEASEQNQTILLQIKQKYVPITNFKRIFRR